MAVMSTESSRPRSSGEERPHSLAVAIERRVHQNPTRRAVAIDEQQLTYEELWIRSEARARQLLALGVRPGKRIGVLLPNCLEYLELIVGAARIGAVVVPMNIRFKSRELRHLICDSGMTALFTRGFIPGVVDFNVLLAESLPGIAAARPDVPLQLAEAPRLRNVVTLGEPAPFMRAEADLARFDGALPLPPPPEAPLFIMYTSGTTANPKGCIVPHRAIVSNAWSIIDQWKLSESDSWWCPLPMFHIGGVVFVMTMLIANGYYAGVSHFDADKAIAALEHSPPTIFYSLFPTITLPIIAHPRFAKLDHSRMRLMCNLAPEQMQRRIQAVVPHAPIVGAFGMTETCGTVCYGLPDDPADLRFTTCGRPLPGWQVKIVDAATHDELPVDARGEIAVRGDGLFQGYLNDPELTASRHLPDGFFLTGDIGSIDHDGLLSFHGRFKDQLKVGGENVAALEVEAFLATHPAVALAHVVGIRDEKYGEVPAAFIELKPGASATEPEIIQYCQNRIARFKVPRHVRFVTEWPMSATKIVKYRLREALEAELLGAPDARKG